MGSDYSMEARNHIPRPSYAEWQRNDLVIIKDYPISGWTETLRLTNPNLEDINIKTLLLTQVPYIPEKPVSIEERLESILLDYYIEIYTTNEAVKKIKEVFNE